MTSLRCEAVTLIRSDPSRGEATILDAVSAEFGAGTVSLITGATGAGKSSLVHLLGGLLRPTSGTIYAGPAAVSRWVAGHRDRWRKKVGVALQAPNLLPELSVLENVMVPLIPRLSRLDEARARAARALEAAGAEALVHTPVGALSGGQRQRVALARATAGEPRYLLADEPTAHQDDAGTERVAALLAGARDRGAVVVVTAHDPRLVEAGVADARWHLAGGKLEGSA